jgi:hypothetical protein
MSESPLESRRISDSLEARVKRSSRHSRIADLLRPLAIIMNFCRFGTGMNNGTVCCPRNKVLECDGYSSFCCDFVIVISNYSKVRIMVW